LRAVRSWVPSMVRRSGIRGKRPQCQPITVAGPECGNSAMPRSPRRSVAIAARADAGHEPPELSDVRRLRQRCRRRRWFGKTRQGLHHGLRRWSPRAFHGRPLHRRAIVVVRHAAPAGLRPAPVCLTIRRQPRIPRLSAFPAMHLRTSDAVVAIAAVEARRRVVSPASRERFRILRRRFGRHVGRFYGRRLASGGHLRDSVRLRSIPIGGWRAADGNRARPQDRRRRRSNCKMSAC
jgi:hypothetical protein